MSRSTKSGSSRQWGQSIMEYAMILALVAMAVLSIIVMVGPAVGNVFSNVIYQINYGPEEAGIPWRGDDSSSYVGPGGGETCNFDGVCDRFENYVNCPSDCDAPGGGAVCGDGVCDAGAGENSLTCAADCGGGGGYCGDGDCGIGENAYACPSDCEAECGDGYCTHGEDEDSCPADCGGGAFDTPTPGGPTPTPECNLLSISAPTFTSDDEVRVTITNGMAQPITIDRIVFEWVKNQSAMVNDHIRLGGGSNYVWGLNGGANDSEPPTDTGGDDAAEWLAGGGSPTILAGISVDLFNDFDSGRDLRVYSLIDDFAYTVTFTNGCVLSNNLEAPATMTPDPGAPTPDCGLYTISAVTLADDDEARATITNDSSQAVAITSVLFVWPQLTGDMKNDWIRLGDSDYIWSGNEGNKDNVSPTDSAGDDSAEWLVGGGSPTITAGTTVDIYNDFDDNPDVRINSYPSQYSLTITLSNGCVLETDTPLPVFTYIRAEETDFTENGSFEHYTDARVSWCYCLRATNTTDTLTYTFDVADPGQYIIWGSVQGETSSRDSWWVSMDGGPEYAYRDLPRIWNWKRVNDYYAGEDPKIFDLEAGTHTLTFRGREAWSGLDAIVITNDLTYTPPLVECAAAVPYFLEAEDGALNSPMVSLRDEDFSRCAYVTVPEGGGTYDGEGWVDLSFSVPIFGDYTIWGRGYGPDTGGDSFYVSVDGGYEYLWDVPRPEEGVRWDEVRHDDREDGTYPDMDPVLFGLDAGAHTVRFRAREDGSMLDAVVIVLSGDYTPPDEVFCGEAPTSTPQPLLTCGSAVTGTISNLDWEDLWQFAGTKDTLVTLTMRRTSGNMDAWLDLIAPDGTVLISDDDHGRIPGDSSTNQDAELAYVLPINGIYTVRATRYNQEGGSSVGGYNLSMGCRALTSAPIDCGDTFEDSIEEGDWLDLWTFASLAGTEVTIRMDSVSGSSLDEYLILLDPEGTILVEDDDSGSGNNARITDYTLPVSGIYTIVATRYNQANGTTTGGYQIQIACQLTQPIACGETKVGRITDADWYDYWEFTASAGDFVSITMYKDPATPELDPYIDLYHSYDLSTRIAYNDDYGYDNNAALDYAIPATGSYTIRARRYHGYDGDYEEGEYTLTLTCHTPQAIACGQTLPGTLDSTDYWDIYAITVPQSGRIDVGQFVRSGDLEAYVRIYDSPTHNALNGTDIGTDSIATNFSVTSGHTYYLRAARDGESHRSSDTDMTGSYDLTLKCTWYVPPENTVACNTLVPGSITHFNWYDHYRFDATAGQLISVTLYKDGATPSLDPYLRFYDASWSQLSSDNDLAVGNNAALSEYRVPADGTYYIRATRYGEASMSYPEGDYSLYVACHEPQPIACGQTVTGAIDNRDFIDRYTFYGQNLAYPDDYRVRIQQDATGGDLDSKIYLVRPNGSFRTRAPTSDDGVTYAIIGSGENGYNLDAEGTWEIWASRYSTSDYRPSEDPGYAGTYSLTLWCNWQPDCSDFSISTVELYEDDAARVQITNNSYFRAWISRVVFQWPALDPGTQYNDTMTFRGTVWDGTDFTPPTDTDTDSPYLTISEWNRRIYPDETLTLYNDFDNGPDIRTESTPDQYQYTVNLTNGCTLVSPSP